MTETPKPIDHRRARLPENTVVFAIGDIHGQHDMLGKLLYHLRGKIAAVKASNPQAEVHVIGLGDYIDRGSNVPATVEMLLNFEADMHTQHGVKTVLLCGNHDEYFTRLLRGNPKIVKETQGRPNNPHDVMHNASTHRGDLSLQGLQAWMLPFEDRYKPSGGGGISTIIQYLQRYGPEKGFHIGDGKGFRLSICDKVAVNSVVPSHEMLNDITKNINKELQCLRDCVPEHHKHFFERVYRNDHLIIGDYLFTHAGVQPDKSLAEQGFGEGGIPQTGAAKITQLSLETASHFDRRKFLERESLDNCPYVVVHGHTPSNIMNSELLSGQSMRVADTRKSYRIGLDTKVFDPEHGALTCMMLENGKKTFMAVPARDPSRVIEYSETELAQSQQVRAMPSDKRANTGNMR